MHGTLKESDRGRLEPLCGEGGDASPSSRIRLGRGGEGIERAEASFRGRAYFPHRHDTYAIGVTLRGVQRFRYRGEERICLPGEIHVLHPDELHDGEAATEEGFAYRIVYIDPFLIQEALGGAPLPFVRDPVVAAASLPREFLAEAFDLDGEIDELGRTDLAFSTAQALIAAAGGVAGNPPQHLAALMRVRDLIAAAPEKRRSLCELERVAGLDRWTIARQFRAFFGTSPSRFRTLRQLDEVRRSLRSGTSLAMSAAEAGFADQSHMSRRFKRAFGLTPAAWAAAVS